MSDSQSSPYISAESQQHMGKVANSLSVCQKSIKPKKIDVEISPNSQNVKRIDTKKTKTTKCILYRSNKPTAAVPRPNQ